MKVTIPSEDWVAMYVEISDYILEYASLDPIYMEAENGDEILTPEKLNQFNVITHAIENIMSTYLTKGDITNNDNGGEG
ncbi:hypothetical protein [uncultured Mediterranean phage uvMED]|nr:hypothetical protein [uncultured Mediterranean phage uvMED]BAQ87049.1 hypothetical protein [uncultured Mediterranean phage uvMED]BAQ87104.1 hypothetical protein [uncultured Mediterranean phage uvMED]BAR16686.1 hypothetical protein [uncultured Mediterranean phage uvMED]